MTHPDGVACRRDGAVGRITLDRPTSRNALDLTMIRRMLDALTRWERDTDVDAIVIDSSDDRTFCAGGDIVAVHDAAHGHRERARLLWREEYRLDARIAHYPKPVVTLMNGLTLGGGMGIGCHASVRIVSDRAALAMPEVAIGLAPDVAGTLLLSRAPGRIGVHLALTGQRVDAHDAVYCGLADHVVASSSLSPLVADLAAGCPPTAVGAEYAVKPRPALPTHRAWIDDCYGTRDVEGILQRLSRRTEPTAVDALDAISAGAPTALKVTLRAMEMAHTHSGIGQCLRQDYRVCSRFLLHPDLAEGIRAAVIDKDHTPKWDPADLTAVTDADVDRFFQPLDDDLVL
ncbi:MULTISPECIES: enoyl-CoA hydratase/isomerase family protein [Prauserella salsuginis group]|uniref:3-hydroxyisobutyryl-CoA hydrolase n=1 Tax=Prauserella salsuginis TaxID=387889 RepID=A0ABW6G678_9PSEU|nr:MULTISPECIES: enoyl-CoA hydratase/isomerase family protein [Prauserella salsuginis group]MCR3719302.1 enoyl-CoA hydratase [Prauserella flava]MCR3735685.1 enoyl-CoA hydratase [Prauserella salsuginis]